AMPSPSRGTAALFSCKGGERAFEDEKYKHGIFFYHVIGALRGEGKAKNKHGAVTWDGLTRHVREAVGDDVVALVGKGARQTPHLVANVEGDPVLVPAGKVVKSAKVEVVKDDKGFTNSLGMKFVRIPATGEKGFVMGSTDEERKEVRKAQLDTSQRDYLK